MRFMVIVLRSPELGGFPIQGGEVQGAVTRTKRQAYEWLESVKTTINPSNVLAWRYHDGNGWADGSDEAWRHIQSLPSRVAVEIYR